MKILVAEDNLFYRCMLEATLAEWGYGVVAVEDGGEAWQILREKDAPRIAILDRIMPGVEGLELCRRVRALARQDPTYIILLTIKGSKEDIIAGLEGGADDYISKPFDREELHARLQVGLRIVGLQSSLAARVRELEQALSGAQKMEAVGRLAGGVAHDFNNLLTVILGSSDFMLGRGKLDDADQESAAMIRDAGRRGAALTRQLLTFSRRQVLAPEILSLNDRVTSLEGMLRCLVGADITLVTDLDPDLCPVETDPGQIEQVIMNLAVNSRDAMPQGGRLTIRTRNAELDEAYAEDRPSVRPGTYAVLAVEDSGLGMEEETKRHLFEPFFTTKEVGKGTGLGLATVYGIVKQSDGHIEVESEPGRGTTFKIFLPRAREAARAVRPSQLLKPRPSQGSETVLLVEDEDGVRALARTILLVNQYNVLEARDGAEALRVTSDWSRPIDLMVTDVVMPQLSGYQLADRLKPARPSMKVLFMSGYTDDAISHPQVLGPGAHFLQKPFTPDVLARKVREVLDG